MVTARRAEASSRVALALRLYLDQWLAATAAGDESPTVREGRRRRWFETSLAPLRDSADDDSGDRLITALCFLTGIEALVVLRDVCHLGPDEGLRVVGWAAGTLLRATFGDVPSTA